MNQRRTGTVFHHHPFELAIAAVLLLSGARALYNPGALPSSVLTLPEFFGIVYRFSLPAAGALMLTGLLTRGRWDWGSACEQAGLWFGASIFGAYGVAAVLGGINSEATIFALMLFSVAGACVFRARAIAVNQKLVGYAIREAHRTEEAP